MVLIVNKRGDFDVLIIGGGPGGLSAALWCADLYLNTAIVEKESEYGGQLLWTHNAITNYLGVDAQNGRELRDRFFKQIENRQIKRSTGAEIVRADLSEKTVDLADGRRFSANAIVIATGVRRRKLDIPGEKELLGKGVLESGVKSKNEMTGKTIVIVGGGDAALENALLLAETAAKVTVVHRREEFTTRNDFIERAANEPKIEFRLSTQVTAIVGNTTVEGVEIFDAGNGKHAYLQADAVLIRIGVAANSELFCGQIATDDAGYIMVDRECRTDLGGVFAVGDVANPISPTISTAVGMGATAAKTISHKLSK